MKFFQIARLKSFYRAISLLLKPRYFNFKMMLKSILILPMSLITGLSAMAQVTGPIAATTTVNSVQTTQISQSNDLAQKLKSNNEFLISLVGESYLQSNESSAADEQIFELRHKYKFKQAQNSIQTNFILGHYEKNRSTYFAAPEFFYQYSSSAKDSIDKKYTVGRKILNTSQLDDHFNLGLTNSYFTQDFISFQKQGLMGFHQDITTKDWSLNISLLPIYLPNQGPGIKESNGKIEGSNRWVKRPPAQFGFNGTNKEIIYSVNYSDITNLILSPGALLQMRVGPEDSKVHLVTSVSKRPLNEPVLERETFANLDIVGKVNLIPNVIYNDLLTADLRYQNEQTQTAVSYISDRPENKSARNFYSIQKLSPIYGYSVFLEHNLIFSAQRSALLGVSMAELTGGEIIDMNADGSENIFTVSKQRLQYKKPIQVYIKAELFHVAGHPAATNLKWLYDREQNGSVLNAEVSVHLAQALNTRMGFDLIGTEQQKTEGTGFLQEFQANDRVYGGLDYVF